MLRLVALIGLSSIVASCTSGDNKSTDGKDQSIDLERVQREKIVKEAKKVMYSLPSPIETAMLIKRAGAIYDETLLNPTANVSKYNTTKSMALAMGVYGADLSYASIFDQTQTSMKYMTASKKLADQLGLLSSIDSKIIERLESNVNDRDSIIRIISETFMNSNSTLKEDNRPAIAAMILAGGWIEGVYLATSLTESVSQKELIERIVDQRLSLNELLKLLETNNDNADCLAIFELMGGLKIAFDAIEIQTSRIEPVTDKDSRVTTLKASSQIKISPEQFESLKSEALALRTAILK
jgi:hypothetical protein